MAVVLLAAHCGLHQTHGGDGEDQAAQSAAPPREPRQVNRHLQGKEHSHEQEAATQAAELRECDLVQPGLFGARVNALRLELYPASAKCYYRAKCNKYPI